MRGRFAVVGLLAVGCLSACADRRRPQPVDGRLAVLGPLDFGTVVVNHGRRVELLLRNVGRSPVHLDELWALGPDRAFEARLVPGERLLMAGDEIGVRVRFTPRFAGEQLGLLGVLTDSRVEPVFRAGLRGVGVAGAARVATERLDFGRIEADSQKQLSFSVDNPSEIEVEVTPKVVGADQDELDSGPAFTLGPGERREVAVVFSPTRVGRKLLAIAVAPCISCADEIVPVSAEALEQAVVAEPPDLDFGPIPVDREDTRPVALHNLSTEPMQVDGLEIAASSDLSFSVEQPLFPLTLRPDERRDFPVHYTPAHMGEAAGQLSFAVRSRRHPTTEVALVAFGGAAELCVSPLSYDFDERPVGSRTAVTLHIKSCGASNAPAAEVTGIRLGPAPGASGADQFVLAPIPLPRTLAAGEELRARLYFAPTRSGAAAAQVLIDSSAYGAQPLRLGFTGRGEQHGPCDVAVSPALVDFGTVAPGQGAVLGIKVENRGQDLCPVSVSMQDDAGGAFWLPGGNLDGIVMDPDNAFSFMVAFRSSGPGAFSGSVQLVLGSPGLPVRTVPLRANSQASCLVATPAYLDFGVARPDCPPGPRSTHLENACAQPATVRGLAIGAGTTDGQFVLTPAAAAFPAALAPGQALTAEVSYLASVPGMNLAPLFVEVDGLAAPLLVPLVGESDWRMRHTDRFTQQDGNKLDVLFVIDNTASMIEEQPRLVAALPAFIDAARAAGLDLHAGVTTTGIEPASPACPGGARGGEAGRLFPADGSAPRILTLASANAAAALQHNAEVGQCAFVERGLEAARRALTPPLVDQANDPRTTLPADGNLGFLRDEAALAVVFVGDEDDHSGDDVDTYVRFFRALKGVGQPARATLFAIAPNATACSGAGGTGTRYEQAALKSGGDALSVCSADYGAFLAAVASRAVGPQERFPLSEPPDPATIEVVVDGHPVTAFTYDAARNQVVFSSRPVGGAQITISYRRVCR